MPYTKQHLKADLAANPEAFLTEPSIPEERWKDFCTQDF